jgi:hypothetical protein
MAGIGSRREVEMSVRALWMCLFLALPLAAGAGETRRQLSLPVSFETSDGFVLKGDLTSAADTDAPVAILLHMYRSNRRAWAPLSSAAARRWMWRASRGRISASSFARASAT